MRKLFPLLLLVLSLGATAQPDSLPAINRRVVDFVNRHMGSQVGRGECWDLAAEALNAAGAEWDGNYGFGSKVDPGKESVLPGDIVQFEGVRFEWDEGREKHTMRMPHHTAVILQVRSRDNYVIAEQNTQGTGRKVGSGDLQLARRTKGRITFYRPKG